MNFLEGKHDARERRMEGCRHAGAGAAGDQEPFLSPSAPEQPGDALGGHAAKLHRRAFPAKREACEGPNRSFRELGEDDLVPRRVHLPHDLGVYLRNSRT